MKQHRNKLLSLSVALLGLAASTQFASAQFFNTPGDGDLMVGFRKAGAHIGTNDVVAYAGNITNLLALSPGATITIGNVTSTALNYAFSSDYTFLQFSVFSAVYESGTPWVTPLGSFPQSTLWYTLPRPSSSVQSTPVPRFTLANQTLVGNQMLGIGNGAKTIGGQLTGGTNAENNSVLVVEPVQAQYQQFYLDTFMADTVSNTLGDFTGNVFTFSVEQVTTNPFSSPVREDLWESAPAPSGRPIKTFTDPITGSTSSVYYVGYFELGTTGTLTFTRASNTPPPPVLTITRNGNTNNISFTSASGATYNLIFTNLSGVNSPRSNWFTLGGSVTGSGGVTNFTDTNAVSGRVYGVTAH